MVYKETALTRSHLEAFLPSVTSSMVMIRSSACPFQGLVCHLSSSEKARQSLRETRGQRSADRANSALAVVINIFV